MASKASGDLGQSGLTHAEATKVMAEGMGKVASANGKSGAKLRDEMLAMGYSYEEQGEVMASYMAQQRAAGKDLKNIAPEELARGTREYAANLKVISDITGQDAKKLAEKARAEAMRGALMGKLSADQSAAFQQANQVMSKFGPEAQNALTQFMATGQVTDPAIAANKEMMELIRQTASSVKEGDKDIAAITADRMKTASDGMKNDETLRATSTANLMGASDGAAGAIGKFADAAMAAGQTIGSGTESKKAAEAQADLAGSAGSVEQGFAKITGKAQDLAVEMEKLTGSHLGEYAQRSADAFKTAGDAVTKMAKAIDSVHSSTIQPAANAGGKALEDSYNMYAGYAEGGWSSGPASGFLEKLHGTELIIPTSGGAIDTTSKGFSSLVDAVSGGNNGGMDQLTKTISGLTDAMSEKSSNGGMDMLAKKIDNLIDAMSKSTGPKASGTDMIADAFNGLQDMLAKQLDVQQDMAGHAKDNKDLVQKLLNVSM
jgi:hypothetical protein